MRRETVRSSLACRALGQDVKLAAASELTFAIGYSLLIDWQVSQTHTSLSSCLVDSDRGIQFARQHPGHLFGRFQGTEQACIFQDYQIALGG